MFTSLNTQSYTVSQKAIATACQVYTILYAECRSPPDHHQMHTCLSRTDRLWPGRIHVMQKCKLTHMVGWKTGSFLLCFKTAASENKVKLFQLVSNNVSIILIIDYFAYRLTEYNRIIVAALLRRPQRSVCSLSTACACYVETSRSSVDQLEF
jgi:hypothetical protein